MQRCDACSSVNMTSTNELYPFCQIKIVVLMTQRILHESCIMEFIKRIGGKDKMRGFAERLTGFPPTSLINSIIQEHK